LVKNQSLSKIEFIILVEGQMDAISLYQAGVKNVLAPMGTAFTPEHAKLIKKFTNLVYICFDSDIAGQNATWKSMDVLDGAGLDVKVVSLPEGSDPDDIIKTHGKDKYLEYVLKALPLTEFKIRFTASKFNLSVPQQKNKFVKEAVEILGKLPDIAVDAHMKIVSDLTGVYDETLKNSVKAIKDASAKTKLNEKISSFATASDSEEPVVENDEKQTVITAEMRVRIIAARYLLSSFLNGKEFANLSHFKMDFFDYKPHQEVYLAILRHEGKKLKVGALFDIIPQAQAEIQKLIDGVQSVPSEKQADYYKECLERLKKAAKDKRIAEIIDLLKTEQNESLKTILKEELRALTARGSG
jgi:DNA primase